MNRITSLFAAVLLGSAAGLATAQNIEQFADPNAPRIAPMPRGVGASAGPGDLVIGTGAFGGTVANNAFVVDPVANSSSPAFSGVAVGGMTYDAGGQRMLFTTSGVAGETDFSSVFAWPIAGGAPTQVGTITAGGTQMRVDGLAIANGTLYGVQQFDAGALLAGLYSIDMTTFEATFLGGMPSGAVSGLGADPATGQLYAVNDADGALQTVALDGTLATVAAYPAGEVDIDGLAVGGGAAYLTTDEAGSIHVYDFGSGVYSTLTSPFSTSDTFSGAGFVSAPPLPESIPVPAFGSFGALLLVLLTIGLGAAVLIRRS